MLCQAGAAFRRLGCQCARLPNETFPLPFKTPGACDSQRTAVTSRLAQILQDLTSHVGPRAMLSRGRCAVATDTRGRLMCNLVQMPVLHACNMVTVQRNNWTERVRARSFRQVKTYRLCCFVVPSIV